MILVTGGAGFIGSHLCHRLVLEGYQVISLDDYSTGSEENHWPGVDYRRGHTTQIAELVPEFPDVIFHLGEYARVEASFGEEDAVYRSNYWGSFAVFHFWQERCAKLVYAGSSTQFATDATDSPYSLLKANNCSWVKWARDVLSKGKLSLSITYFYNVYGPGERSADNHGTAIETFRRQTLAGLPLTVVAPGTQRRNFTHVDDIVDGLLLAMEHDGEFQIGAAESYSVLEVAAMFGGEIEMLPERKGNRMASTIDTSAIRALGWKQQHKLEDYIREATNDQRPSPRIVRHRAVHPAD